MELKLEKGLYAACAGGGVETVSGREETLQRVRMRLCAPKGKFLPLPGYGSELHKLGRLKAGEREAAARQYVAQALAEETGVSLVSVSYIPGEDDSAGVDVVLRLSGGETGGISLEV